MKTILIADDDPDYLFQMKVKLERFGYRVITADSQKEAGRILETVKPDLAILDLMMETEDSGFILAHKISRMYPGLPVIIASGVTAETGMDFGPAASGDRSLIKADLFIDKGITAERLEREIQNLMQKH
ncbi:MAG TPA: response regulator [Bacteroidales bacterium]|nr:response regulator [Bacteroidales bacterium]HSA42497.1 response regulator [Bacteroidales bacterium]